MPRNYDREKARAQRLQRVYGITVEQYDEILAKQNGGCAICAKTPEQEGIALAVDHDHKSNIVRGILCRYCNHRVVGRHRDSDLLRRVADYLDNDTGFVAPVKPKKKRVRRPRKVKAIG